MIDVRTALPAELPALGELCARSYIAGSGMGPDDDYAEVLRDASTRARVCDVLAAVRVEGPTDVDAPGDGGSRLVGTATICAGSYAEIARPGEVEFRFLAVDPGSWGMGVGQALVEEIVARASGLPVVCTVIRRNDPAHALYTRLGFARVPERDWIPAPGVELLAYRRDTPTLS